MKMTFIPIVILSLSIVACNNNKPKESVTITSEDGKEQITIDANQAGNAAVEMEKTKEELGKLTPLSAEVVLVFIQCSISGYLIYSRKMRTSTLKQLTLTAARPLRIVKRPVMIAP